MKRTLIHLCPETLPRRYRHLLNGTPVFDSSCSPEAKVYYLDTNGGLFLKSAPKGTLQTEALLNAFFFSKHLGPEVVDYFSEDRDWLLTRRIPGEDCTHPQYLRDPKRLCDITATRLRELHETVPSGCPVSNRMEAYYTKAARSYEKGFWEPDLFQSQWHFSSIEDAWQTIQAYLPHMKNDTLLHGDYCLPNIMLDDWKFSGFIDLGGGGIGDRHMDILWGIWTLQFNLHTNQYRERFMDAYGRDRIEPELLRAAAALEIF